MDVVVGIVDVGGGIVFNFVEFDFFEIGEIDVDFVVGFG